MRRIKDFIYNTSDILVTILIVVIALLLIIWRVDIIMTDSGASESDNIFHNISVKVSGVFDRVSGVFSNDDSESDAPASGKDDSADAPGSDAADDSSEESGKTDADNAGGTAAENPASPDGNAADNPAAPSQAPGSTFTITVAQGDSGMTIGQKLVNAGAIEKPEDFVQALVAAKADRKIGVGEFVIPTGLNADQIVQEMIK